MTASIWERGDEEVSLARLYVIRLGSLAGVVSLGSEVLPKLIWPDPVGRGISPRYWAGCA